MKSKQDLLRLHQEKINHFRKINHIHTKGADIPDPIDDWDTLKLNYGVTEDVLAVLKSSYQKLKCIVSSIWPMCYLIIQNIQWTPLDNKNNEVRRYNEACYAMKK